MPDGVPRIFLPPPPPQPPTNAAIVINKARIEIRRNLRMPWPRIPFRDQKSASARIKIREGKSGGPQRPPGRDPSHVAGTDPRTPVFGFVVITTKVTGMAVPGVMVALAGVKVHVVSAGRSPGGNVVSAGLAIGGHTNVTV